MDKESVTLNDVGDLSRRRWPVAAAVFLAVVLAAVVIAYSLDDLYASAGIIDIEESDVARGTVDDTDRELRIYRINDDVMSRESLEPVVEKFDLYPEIRGDQPGRAVVWLLRKNIQLDILRKETEASSRDAGPVVGFSVKFFHPDQRTAKNVATELQKLYMDANFNREERAIQEELELRQRELEDTRGRLDGADEAIVDFKKRYPNAMPEDRRRIQAQIDRKDGEGVRVDGDIRTLESKAEMLRIQILDTPPFSADDSLNSEVERLKTEYVRLISLYGENHPDVRRVRKQLDGLMGGGSSALLRQILQVELDNAQREYAERYFALGEEHPDRKAAERKIERLREQIDALPEPSSSTQPTNPDYIMLQQQLAATERELRAQRGRQAALRAEIESLNDSMEIAPEVESELNRLIGDRSIIQDKYTLIQQQIEGLNRKLNETRREVGQYWEVKKEPSLPYLPDFPNRPLYIVLGVFLGLTLGIGAALASEALDSTIRGARDVRHVMQMPPIAAIPVIKTPADVRRDRMRHVAVAAGVLVAVGAVGLYVHLQTSGVI